MDKFVQPLVVTMDDGMKFRCSVSALGRETEPRWMLLDADGVQYVGPIVEPDKSPEAVERLVSEWWKGVKAARAAAPTDPQH